MKRSLAFPPRAAVDATTTIPRYLITLDTPLGQGQIEVPSFLGPEVAARRAHISACAIGWGDLNTVIVRATELIVPNSALVGLLGLVS